MLSLSGAVKQIREMRESLAAANRRIEELEKELVHWQTHAQEWKGKYYDQIGVSYKPALDAANKRIEELVEQSASKVTD